MANSVNFKKEIRCGIEDAAVRSRRFADGA